mgnify:CR=1 FL=1
MKHLKRTRALLSMLFALVILATCISFPMSASANVGSAYTMGGQKYSDTDIQKFAYWWDACGWHSYWNHENTYDYVNSERLNSDIICLVGHGNPLDVVLTNNNDPDLEIRVTNGYNDISQNHVGLKSRSLNNVRMAYLCGCDTAGYAYGGNICEVAVAQGADCAIGWNALILNTDVCTFRDRFGYLIKGGSTVAAAAAYAASFNDYHDTGIKAYVIYGNANTVLKKSAVTRSMGLPGANAALPALTFRYEDTDYQPIFNALRQLYPQVDFSSYEVSVTSNDPSNKNFIVDVTETVNGYQTNSGYSLVFLNEKLESVRDNTIAGQRPITSHRLPSASDIAAAKQLADQKVEGQNDGGTVYDHHGKAFYDIESGKYYYRLFTVVDYDGAKDEILTDYEII